MKQKRLGVRIVLTEEEADWLLLLDVYVKYGFDKNSFNEKELEIIESIQKKISAEKYKPKSYKKIMAAEKARRHKSQKAKEKISNAVNLLLLEGKEVSISSVANTAGVSYNTAKKYSSMFEAHIK